MDYETNVDLAKIVELVDSEFQARHPDLKGRQINVRSAARGASDDKLRAEWNEMFTAEAMKAMRLASRRVDDARAKWIANA